MYIATVDKRVVVERILTCHAWGRNRGIWTSDSDIRRYDKDIVRKVVASIIGFIRKIPTFEMRRPI